MCQLFGGGGGGAVDCQVGVCSECRKYSLGGSRKRPRLQDRALGWVWIRCVTLDESLQLSESWFLQSENENTWEGLPGFPNTLLSAGCSSSSGRRL